MLSPEDAAFCSLSFFTATSKPDLSRFNDYVVHRRRDISPQTPGLGFSKHHDLFDNTVLTSTHSVEPLLVGYSPAMLVVSRKGIELFRRNPGLMGMLVRGQGSLKYVGERVEGKVYETTLRTRDGDRRYALKQTFPVQYGSDEDPGFYFSSQVDEMLLQQRAQQDIPVSGLHMVVPVAATHNVAVRPYIDSAVTMGDMIELMHPGEDQEAYLNRISSTQRQLLSFIRNEYVSHQGWDQFWDLFAIEIEEGLRQLRKWFYQVRDDPNMPLTCDRKQLVFDGNHYNTLINLNKLISLFNNLRLSQEQPDKFKLAVIDACYIIEIACGVRFIA